MYCLTLQPSTQYVVLQSTSPIYRINNTHLLALLLIQACVSEDPRVRLRYISVNVNVVHVVVLASRGPFTALLCVRSSEIELEISSSLMWLR
jgi:hypothetical protein